MSTLTIGSMFSGIGGLELGLESLGGFSVKWHSEIEAYPSAVLERRYSGSVPNLGDCRAIEWNELRHVDLLTAGFPCQPASVAGKRRGSDDDRWLWPEVERALRLLRPEFALLENVPGLLSVDGGRLFGLVLADLAALGYDAWWDCVRAADLGAPHRRERLFIVAHARERGRTGPRLPAGPRQEGLAAPDAGGGRAELSLAGLHAVVNPSRAGREERHAAAQSARQGHAAAQSARQGHAAGRRAEVRQPRALGDSQRSGLQEGSAATGREEGAGTAVTGGQLHEAGPDAAWHSDFWDTGVTVRGHDATVRLVEPGIRPLADGIPGRVARLKALGNAVCPEQSRFIGALLKASIEGENNAV